MTNLVTPTDFVHALRARDRDGINRTAAALLDQRTRLGDEWSSIAHVLVRTGEVSLAISAAERAVEETAGSAKARFQLAHVLSNVGLHADAVSLVSAITPSQLTPVERDHFLGTCAMEMGNFDVAREAFERVLEIWRGAGPTWLSLAALPAEDDASLLDRLEAASTAMAAAQSDYRAQWHYAKGTVLDRMGRTDEAFSQFTAGAELVKPTRPYDPAADRAEAEMLMREFTRTAIDRIAEQVGIATDRPVLVTGLPRSGTTLVEQILASHSAIAGGGEMPFGSILSREIGGNSLARLEPFVADQGADQLARLYLHLGDEFLGRERRFVDKGLSTSRFLGVLASVLPQARIIWLRRNPLDCAWSCFRTYFSQGIEWSWSLTDIAAHFEAEDRLYAHWREVLGERVLTVVYEELTAEPEREIGRILDHLELEPEPGLYAVHKTERAVTTASVMQVRQPVYRTSVGAADRYRRHLEPFMAAYSASALA